LIINSGIQDSIVENLKVDGEEYANQIWLVDTNNDIIGGIISKSREQKQQNQKMQLVLGLY